MKNLNFNGTIIADDKQNMKFNGADVTEVRFNGVTFWKLEDKKLQWTPSGGFKHKYSVSGKEYAIGYTLGLLVNFEMDTPAISYNETTNIFTGQDVQNMGRGNVIPGATFKGLNNTIIPIIFPNNPSSNDTEISGVVVYNNQNHSFSGIASAKYTDSRSWRDLRLETKNGGIGVHRRNQYGNNPIASHIPVSYNKLIKI